MQRIILYVGSVPLMLLPLSACSVADYGKPIGDFAAATATAESALIELDQTVTDAYVSVQRRRAVSERVSEQVFIKTEDGSCEVTSSHCRLVAIDRKVATPQVLSSTVIPNTRVLMAEINDYAEELRALVDADTAAQVEGHVNGALGSVQELAATVSTIRNGTDATNDAIPEFATPTGKAINWLVGQYVARVKLRGLRQATNAAKSTVADAAALCSTIAKFAADPAKARAADQVTTHINALRDERTERNFDEALAAARQYDALLSAQASDVFTRMADAHNALADGLNDKNVSLPEAIAKINRFANEARTLAGIVQELRSIGQEETTTDGDDEDI